MGGGRGTIFLTDTSVCSIREKFTSGQMCFHGDAVTMIKEVNGIGTFTLHLGPLSISVFFN